MIEDGQVAVETDNTLFQLSINIHAVFFTSKLLGRFSMEIYKQPNTGFFDQQDIARAKYP